MELSDALNFARANRWAILTTLRGNGLPQQPDVTQPDFRAYAVLEGAVVRFTPDRVFGAVHG